MGKSKKTIQASIVAFAITLTLVGGVSFFLFQADQKEPEPSQASVTLEAPPPTLTPKPEPLGAPTFTEAETVLPSATVKPADPPTRPTHPQAGAPILARSVEISGQELEATFELEKRNAEARFTSRGAVEVTIKPEDYSAINLRLKGPKWNFTDYRAVGLTFQNTGRYPIQALGRVIGWNNWPSNYRTRSETIFLEPGERKELLVFPYVRTQDLPDLNPLFEGMRGIPGGHITNWGNPIESPGLLLSALQVESPISYELQSLRLLTEKELRGIEYELTLPIIDRFGQFNQGDWPGKLASEAEFPKRIEAEEAELTAYPGPEDRSRFGGWATGPRLRATGYFRVEEYRGKWWFVDPEGHLFWSHGVTCVDADGAITEVTSRTDLFEELPDQGSEFAQFYSARDRNMFNFTAANLYRKFGANWKQKSIALSHRRLKSWGMNTFGNWSDREYFETEQTPYTVPIWYQSRKLGPDGLPEVWGEQFLENMDRAVARSVNEITESPWNLGFYIDNELKWKDPKGMLEMVLRAPSEQPSKTQLGRQLHRKYRTISSLNRAWGTDYSDWKDILSSTTVPPYERTQEDAEQFTSEFAERYFSTCRAAIKKHYPNHLYLGCRFLKVTDAAIVKVADRYCDVLSINIYARTLHEFKPSFPEVERPILVTEFHFGALDRGLFHGGLQLASNQRDRAQHYFHYVRTGLEHPQIVGTHWFQYGSQAFTGRGSDGENYQCGMVDITDTPYPELIQAVRAIGYGMYTVRSQ